MARKFKIGDKVKIVKQYGDIDLPIPVGSEGEITDIWLLIPNTYHYEVTSNKEPNWLAAQELKKI